MTMAGDEATITEAAARTLVRAALAEGRTALNEWESKALLAAYGVPVPPGVLAGRFSTRPRVVSLSLGSRVPRRPPRRIGA
jgi:acetyltransferase